MSAPCWETCHAAIGGVTRVVQVEALRPRDAGVGLHVDLPQPARVLVVGVVGAGVAAGLGEGDRRHRHGLVGREPGLAGEGVDLLRAELAGHTSSVLPPSNGRWECASRRRACEMTLRAARWRREPSGDRPRFSPGRLMTPPTTRSSTLVAWTARSRCEREREAGGIALTLDDDHPAPRPAQDLLEQVDEQVAGAGPVELPASFAQRVDEVTRSILVVEQRPGQVGRPIDVEPVERRDVLGKRLVHAPLSRREDRHAVTGRLERHEPEALDDRRVQHERGMPVEPSLLRLGDRPERVHVGAQVGPAEQELGLAGERVPVRWRRSGEHDRPAPPAAAQLGPHLEGEPAVLVQVRRAEAEEEAVDVVGQRRRALLGTTSGSGSETPHDTTADGFVSSMQTLRQRGAPAVLAQERDAVGELERQPLEVPVPDPHLGRRRGRPGPGRRSCRAG